MSENLDLRILIIDDNPEIHQAFIKILKAKNLDQEDELSKLELEIFGPSQEEKRLLLPNFHIATASQGQEGLEEIKKGLNKGEPYALAFVDIRMPPGWDGTETIKQIWKVDPNIQIVICTAYSDYTWEETVAQLGGKDNLLILKKPFDAVTIRQVAYAFTKKWQLAKQTREQMEFLEERITERTKSLQNSLLVTRGTLESSPDAILVIDNSNRIIDYNKKLIHFWDIPVNLFVEDNAATVLSFISKKLRKPELFSEFFKDPQTNVIRTEKLATIDNKVVEAHRQSYKLDQDTIGHIWSFRDITQRALMEEKIQYQATHDPLTNLANRVLLFDRIGHAIEQAKRANMLFGLLFLDLNRFKLINDSLGHAIGDEVLRNVADRLQLIMRKTDTLARMGGDEFVIVTSAFDQIDNIKLFVQKIIESFHTPFTINGHELFINTSIGIAVYPMDGDTPEKLLSNADTAMYNAKEIGGNRFIFYNKELTNYQVNIQLQHDFYAALKNEEFYLSYQPLYDVHTGTLNSIEALVRWNHPTKGILLPIDFIPLAEELGFIIPLGEWILRTACRQNKAWQDQGYPKVVIAVNMGTKQLKQPELVQIIKQILAETQLEARYLEIEITENVFINIVQSKSVLLDLKKLGVKITLDDFGAGYSSINYLRQIEIDQLKIDKSFIDNISKDERDELIIEAIISMGETLGFDVVAEGVETEKQMHFLQKKHCEKVQGYYLSVPLEKDQMENLLSDQLNKK
ncbi:regulatory protein (GGDEF and EAL domains) [Legionella beliardensis]|uniref:Regulatory protein (GGDEF and EAL domains) n=1 Tax=Legionella beliardensis TaxID=91822 RepID=A0A378HYB0_9GAMM|nr:EAL domain-containing protein [Legionella beliardensis]STX27683.1 regulatory protein (GGDEF and EAL domains) [Legionella beliardensis]